MNSALTSIFIRSSFILQEKDCFILSAFPMVIQSLLYFKIRCAGHGFRSPHRACEPGNERASGGLAKTRKAEEAERKLSQPN